MALRTRPPPERVAGRRAQGICHVARPIFALSGRALLAFRQQINGDGHDHDSDTEPVRSRRSALHLNQRAREVADALESLAAASRRLQSRPIAERSPCATGRPGPCRHASLENGEQALARTVNG